MLVNRSGYNDRHDLTRFTSEHAVAREYRIKSQENTKKPNMFSKRIMKILARETGTNAKLNFKIKATHPTGSYSLSDTTTLTAGMVNELHGCLVLPFNKSKYCCVLQSDLAAHY